jgi:hypothetical protein
VSLLIHTAATSRKSTIDGCEITAGSRRKVEAGSLRRACGKSRRTRMDGRNSGHSRRRDCA